MSQYSLDELRQRYLVEKRPLETSVEQILRADTRAGTRAILASIDKRRFENRSEGQRLRKMLRFETSLWERGYHAVAGVDEAGMSPRRAGLRSRRDPETRNADNRHRRLEKARRRGSRRTLEGDQGKGRELVCGIRRGRGDRRDQHLLGRHSRYASCGP